MKIDKSSSFQKIFIWFALIAAVAVFIITVTMALIPVYSLTEITSGGKIGWEVKTLFWKSFTVNTDLTVIAYVMISLNALIFIASTMAVIFSIRQNYLNMWGLIALCLITLGSIAFITVGCLPMVDLAQAKTILFQLDTITGVVSFTSIWWVMFAIALVIAVGFVASIVLMMLPKIMKNKKTKANAFALFQKIFIWFTLIASAAVFAVTITFVLLPNQYLINAAHGMENTLTSLACILIAINAIILALGITAMFFNKKQNVFGIWGVISIWLLILCSIAFVVIGCIPSIVLFDRTVASMPAQIVLGGN